MFDDTIAAIATPLGEGGLAVVRVSGADAFVVADKIFKVGGRAASSPVSSAPTHTIHYGKIVRHGDTVDEVLLSILRAPRTFTREDTIEISCHGGLLPAKLVLDTILETARGWPGRANLPAARFSTVGSTWPRPRPWLT